MNGFYNTKSLIRHSTALVLPQKVEWLYASKLNGKWGRNVLTSSFHKAMRLTYVCVLINQKLHKTVFHYSIRLQIARHFSHVIQSSYRSDNRMVRKIQKTWYDKHSIYTNESAIEKWRCCRSNIFKKLNEKHNAEFFYFKIYVSREVQEMQTIIKIY